MDTAYMHMFFILYIKKKMIFIRTLQKILKHDLTLQIMS